MENKKSPTDVFEFDYFVEDDMLNIYGGSFDVSKELKI